MQRGKHPDEQADRWVGRQMDMHAHTHGYADGQTDRWTDRRMEKQTGGQKDRRTLDNYAEIMQKAILSFMETLKSGRN